jgi:hypothetical protein
MITPLHNSKIMARLSKRVTVSAAASLLSWRAVSHEIFLSPLKLRSSDSENFGTPDRRGVRLTVPARHKDLADLVGASRPLARSIA